MIIYFENSKYATKNLLEVINELSKAAGYKVFLYTNNELLETLRKQPHLQLHQKEYNT